MKRMHLLLPVTVKYGSPVSDDGCGLKLLLSSLSPMP